MASQASETVSFRLTRDPVSMEIDGITEDDTQKLFSDTDTHTHTEFYY